MYCLKCGTELSFNTKYCQNCGEPTPLSDETKVGKINVIREKKMFGFAISFSVYVDDTLLGQLNNNSKLSTDIALGEHKITFKSTEKDVIQEVTLSEEKKEVNIYIVPKMGLIAAKPSIKEIIYK